MKPNSIAAIHAGLRALAMWYLIYCILDAVPSTDLMWFLYRFIITIDVLVVISLICVGLYAGHKERRG